MNLTYRDHIERTRKRAESNDRRACYALGWKYFRGFGGLEQNDKKALEFIGQAADLGSNRAHHALGIFYLEGTVVAKDEEKAMHHLRLAAIGGVAESRYALGVLGSRKNDTELALTHWIIAAEAGNDESLGMIKQCYMKGHVTKDVFARALRAHKSVTDELKSDQRDRAAALYSAPS